MSSTGSRRSSRLRKRSLSSNANNQTIPSSPSSSEPYGSLKVTELRDLLRRRGLAVSGVKSVLVERLTSSSATDSPTTTTTTTTNAAEKDTNESRRTIAKRARKGSGSSKPIAQSTKSTFDSQKSPRTPSSIVDCLPRTREHQLQSAHEESNSKMNLSIIGVDEAGRGPLAGPVVAAAAIVPTDIAGIVDSKKITKEDERERLYEELIASPDVRYAVAVVGAGRIDEINILQATLEGMRMAVDAVMNAHGESEGENERGKNVASAERQETSYVITGGNAPNGRPKNNPADGSYHALIDGNKIPKGMPCPSESLVKGDGREYSIGAASILAKVTRDRLMREYSEKYPDYNLGQHKGYPTAAHMSAVRKFGASPIHRRTFAPLKHMEFDERGKIIG